MRFAITAAITAAIIALATGCSVDTLDDTDVNPDVIWGRYEARFDAQNNTLWRSVQFRAGGSSGTTVRLTGDANILVDGDRLRVVDGDENPINLVGTFYALTSSASMPPAVHTFVWTRSDGVQFTNPVTQAKAIEVTAPAAASQHPLDAPLTVAWGEALEVGESVVIHLDSQVARNTSVYSRSVEAGEMAVVPVAELEKFPAGPATVHVVRWRREGVAEGHPEEGGQRVSSFVSRKVTIELTAPATAP